MTLEWLHRYQGNQAALNALKSFMDFYMWRMVEKDGEEEAVPTSYSTWYAGFTEYASTNNALECANRIFKDRETFRKRLPMREFLDVASKAVRKWSINPDFQV